MFSIIVPLFKEQKLFEFIKYNLLIKLELEELQGRNNNHINFTKLKGDLFGVQSIPFCHICTVLLALAS